MPYRGEPDEARGPEDVAAYGAIAGALAAGRRPRAEVLAEHGLDEEMWQGIDDAWQAMLSVAITACEVGVPPLLTAYAEAFALAQRAEAQPALLSLERYVEATRALERSNGEIAAAMKNVGVTLDEFLRANEHWARRMIADPELARRFAELLAK